MKGEFITLETVKKIEEIKNKKKDKEQEKNKMNTSLIEANVKLQDENKIVKNDNLLLQKRIKVAAELLKSKLDKFKMFDLEDIIQDAIDILEGNYVYNNKGGIKW